MTSRAVGNDEHEYGHGDSEKQNLSTFAGIPQSQQNSLMLQRKGTMSN